MQVDPYRPTLDLSRDDWSPVFQLHPSQVYSNEDVIDSEQLYGGYRLSTAVTAESTGTAYKQSVTVHMNHDQDRITMNSDGSFTVTDGDAAIELDYGGGAGLSGGETVNRNDDDSVGISADGPNCRATSTLLRGTGTGIDVDIEGGKDPVCGRSTAKKRHAA
jgi:hypothetical protein